MTTDREQDWQPMTLTDDQTRITPATTNLLAVVSFVLSFVLTVPAVVCGHVALRQIRADRTRGRGLALAGVIVGYVLTVVYFIVTIVVVPFLLLVLTSLSY
jgi:hypothetical protein